MPLITRRPSLPAAFRERLALRPGDRVLAVAELTDGRWVVASRLALIVVPLEGDLLRRPWADVDRAQLRPETSTIAVSWVDGGELDLVLAGPGDVTLARTLRERVQSSVVTAEVLTFPRGARVSVALRRDESGDLFTQVIGAGAVDLDDPAVAQAVDGAEQRLRGSVGLRG